ncbi:MAG TPA: hypothetical protein VF267_05035 [Gammaproteobacteria bacterium]
MKKLIMLFLAGLFSAGAAIANEGNVDFDKLDQDGDGQLSRTEVAQDAELAAQFSTIDANGDGYLDQTEAQSAESQEQESQDQGMGEDY